MLRTDYCVYQSWKESDKPIHYKREEMGRITSCRREGARKAMKDTDEGGRWYTFVATVRRHPKVGEEPRKESNCGMKGRRRLKVVNRLESGPTV
ncbi:hypothetical protein Y032_0009g689 [Ancylostoma ceylanicum]|uniref:Uncharacterized protein n=1 Tax=Ancylostoma ceylanicum TaxID=53326 RepID=A0A016VJB0_9BILA|nr:hypothetical protein Y032_0009g689 [Ancylostoma ceylanicum]